MIINSNIEAKLRFLTIVHSLLWKWVDDSSISFHFLKEAIGQICLTYCGLSTMISIVHILEKWLCFAWDRLIHTWHPLTPRAIISRCLNYELWKLLGIKPLPHFVKSVQNALRILNLDFLPYHVLWSSSGRKVINIIWQNNLWLYNTVLWLIHLNTI